LQLFEDILQTTDFKTRSSFKHRVRKSAPMATELCDVSNIMRPNRRVSKHNETIVSRSYPKGKYMAMNDEITDNNSELVDIDLNAAPYLFEDELSTGSSITKLQESDLKLACDISSSVCSDNDDSCFICLGDFSADDDSKKIRVPCSQQCNNASVHAKCIYEWKERRNNPEENAGSCPLCRQKLGTIDYAPPDLLQLFQLVIFSSRKQFAVRPLAIDLGMLRCYIKVLPSGWFGGCVYQLYLQAPCGLEYPMGALPDHNSPVQGDRLLMTARKRIGLGYIDISLDEKGEDFYQESPNHLGYVSSSLTGLDHTIVSPYCCGGSAAPHRDPGSAELGCINYVQNRIGLSVGPRKMKVSLPKWRQASSETQLSEIKTGIPKMESVPYRPRQSSNSMAYLLREGQQALESEDLVYCENLEPTWLESIQAYSLDFYGRVTLPSNKNFKMSVHTSEADKFKTVLQFGKVVNEDEHLSQGATIYTMDVQFPLSPLQAFGICLSSCDRKLACA